MITVGPYGETYSGHDPHDRKVLARFLPYDASHYRPQLSPAAALIERALWAGVDVTAAIDALDAIEGDADLEAIDEREGPNPEWYDRPPPVWDVCPCCGHKERLPGA